MHENCNMTNKDVKQFSGNRCSRCSRPHVEVGQEDFFRVARGMSSSILDAGQTAER